MEQLRDRTVVVEGNQMVQASLGVSSMTGWSSEVDIKGKSRAVEPPPVTATQINATGMHQGVTRPVHQGVSDPSSSTGESTVQAEDPNEAYFRQENEEYSRYWSEYTTEGVSQAQAASAESTTWDRLQHDWDQFEATSFGVKAVSNYQFQTNNPYLLRASSASRHHTVHLDKQQTFHVGMLDPMSVLSRHLRSCDSERTSIRSSSSARPN
jgi:peroxin-5